MLKKSLGVFLFLIVFFVFGIPKFLDWKFTRTLDNKISLYSQELEFFGGILTVDLPCAKIPRDKYEKLGNVANSLNSYDNASKEFKDLAVKYAKYYKENKEEIELKVESKMRKLKWLEDDYEEATKQLIKKNDGWLEGITDLKDDLKKDYEVILTLYSPSGNFVDKIYQASFRKHMSKNRYFKEYLDKGCLDGKFL